MKIARTTAMDPATPISLLNARNEMIFKMNPPFEVLLEDALAISDPLRQHNDAFGLSITSAPLLIFSPLILFILGNLVSICDNSTSHYGCQMGILEAFRFTAGIGLPVNNAAKILLARRLSDSSCRE